MEGLIELDDIRIPAADGCELSARLWRPAELVRVPAVLEAIPYRKRDGTVARDELMHPHVARAGYATVRVDLRGSGDSGGLLYDEYTPQEMADVLAVISWLAAQPWCTGSVGMMGKSWGGFNCLQAAWNGHPHLRAIVSVCTTTDRFADDVHYKGGCLLGENFGWGVVMLSFCSRPADPLLRGAEWRAEWLQRLEAEPFLAPVWARHQTRDAYWAHGSVCEDWDRLRVPTMVWGGWADGYLNAPAALVTHAPRPVCAVVGPWVHQYPHTAVPGPQVGFLHMCLRWWDCHLKGIANGAEAEPAYRAFILHSAPPDACAAQRPGHWIVEAALPSPRVASLRLCLVGTRALSAVEPSEVFALPISTPQHLGLTAGEYFPMGCNGEMAGDQASDDAMSVCFDGAPLDADLQLLGAARVQLRLSSDEPRAFIVVRLCDVSPLGSSVRIAHGVLNLCHRDGVAQPALVVPGEPLDVTVVLDQMGYRLSAGHRLRVALSTTYWPFVWPSPRPATLTLTAGSITLPVHRGADTNEWAPPEAEKCQPWKHRVLRSPRARRVIEHDLVAATHALVVEDDSGDRESLAHGLCSGDASTERWEVGQSDPLSARVVHTWEQRLMRGAWAVRTRVEALMTSTATQLRMTAQLRAWEGEQLVFERHWNECVDRQWV